jgi:hypothetical protein
VDIDAGLVVPDWSAGMWVYKKDNVTSTATSLMDSNSIYGTSLRLEQFAHGVFDVGITEYTVVDDGFAYAVPLNEWTHLLFTSNGSSASLYVNGSFRGNLGRGYNLYVDKLGTARTNTSNSPLCRMSDVQVYNRILTPAEILSLATVTGCIKGATGAVLDGEFSGTFPSGDGIPGGDFEATFGINLPIVPPAGFALTAPKNGAARVLTAPKFQWTAAAGASSYSLQVATDPGFNSLVVNQPGIPGTSFQPAAAMAEATVYYWRVTAVNAAGTTLAGGSPSSFTTSVSIDLAVQGGCGLLGIEVLILLALRRRPRSA